MPDMTPHESALNDAINGVTGVPVRIASEEGLRWGNFLSRLGPMAYMQVMSAGLTFALLVLLFVVDNKRSGDLQRISGEQTRVQEKLNDQNEKNIVAQANLTNAISNNTLAIGRMESAVMDRLLGLKKDAEVIKKDIKEVKEAPPPLGSMFRRPIPPEIIASETAPMPREVEP